MRVSSRADIPRILNRLEIPGGHFARAVPGSTNCKVIRERSRCPCERPQRRGSKCNRGRLLLADTPFWGTAGIGTPKFRGSTLDAAPQHPRPPLRTARETGMPETGRWGARPDDPEPTPVGSRNRPHEKSVFDRSTDAHTRVALKNRRRHGSAVQPCGTNRHTGTRLRGRPYPPSRSSISSTRNPAASAAARLRCKCDDGKPQRAPRRVQLIRFKPRCETHSGSRMS